MHILAIPGSLRENSSSNQLLKEIVRMIPAGVSFEIYDGVGRLPHFNDPSEIPESVKQFRNKVKAADAILICTPEYAFGVPGSLKNALDWTVSSGDFVGKPVSLITASSHGEKGHAALQLILDAISVRLVEDATLLVSFIKAKLDDGRIKDEEIAAKLRYAMEALVQALT